MRPRIAGNRDVQRVQGRTTNQHRAVEERFPPGECKGFFKVLPALAVSSLLGTTVPGHTAELSVLNWRGYGTDGPWAVEIFAQQTGVKVVHDNFNSEQEMLTKLRTSAGAYDVVLINSSYTCEAAREGLIQPIAPELIANFKDLSPNMRGSSTLNCDGKVYGISWV